jgi:hypothetical protein
MDHPKRCPLCDQHEETINHLLVACVFVRQVWTRLLVAVGLRELVPQKGVASFEAWWLTSSQQLQGQARSAFNSLVIRGAWVIWKHRNKCVPGATPCVAATLHVAREEALLWTRPWLHRFSLLLIPNVLLVVSVLRVSVL